MSKSNHVVDGEASESDTEIEVARSPDVDSPSKTKKFVVTGEAPESDDESKLPPASLKPIMEADRLVIPAPRSPKSATIHNSLLHQKLWEANVSFRANLEGLVKHSIDISVEKLTRSDKTLLNVQESMRATNANLTLARARLKQIRDQLERAHCSGALPTLRTRQPS